MMLSRRKLQWEQLNDCNFIGFKIILRVACTILFKPLKPTLARIEQGSLVYFEG